jgi:hypothetical protein
MEYIKSLYSNKEGNLEELDTFLDVFGHQNVTKRTNILNISITSYVIQTVIKCFLTVNDQMDSLLNHKTFKETLIPLFLKTFHEIERLGTLPNSFYEVKIAWIPKLNKARQKRKLYFLDELRHKSFQ